jgi:hypothetical protein
MNFARRTSCNKCQAPKPSDGGGGGGGGKQLNGDMPHNWCCGYVMEPEY